MTCYPTQSHYPGTEGTSPCPILIMLSNSIIFKVIGLTRPGFENVRSRFEPATFRIPDLPEWEADALTDWMLLSTGPSFIWSTSLHYPLPSRNHHFHESPLEALLLASVQSGYLHCSLGDVDKGNNKKKTQKNNCNS